MVKTKFSQWAGLISFILLIGMIISIWIVTQFNTIIFYCLLAIILLAVYGCTYLFSYQLFEYGERNISSDKELISLEKEEALNLWMYISGAGFTFLIGGLPELKTNPILMIIGLIFLIVGSLVYHIHYHPRYTLLIRKRKIEISLNKKIR